MNTRSFGFLIALVVALVVTPAWADDIAGNGGFENAGDGGATDSDQWAEFGPMSQRDSSNPASGSWAHRMFTQGGGSSGINQSSINDVGLSSLEENTTVTVSMEVEANYGPGGVGFAVLRILNGQGAIVAESGLQNIPAGPYQTWTLPTVTVPAYGAPPNNVYAAFVEINAVSGAFAESTSEVYVDNVTVDATLGEGGPGAQLAPYHQDFEGLVQSDPAALADDGWLIFANVFNADWSYAYGYGVFPAPNGGNGFSAIDVDQGGPDQGDQQLSVYSDYNNADHGNGRFIEANVFQEQVVGAADIGDSWLFEFDAKRGNIEGATSALAFFKTLDPNNGFQLTNFITIDMTDTPDEWQRYGIEILIDAGLVGQILQFGYLSTATAFEGSGIFYDNVKFEQSCAGEDDVAPEIEIFNVQLVFGAPISMYVNTSDDDDYPGGVVAERAYIDDCLIFDGATYGDADGLLTDDALDLSAKEFLAIVSACNFQSIPTTVRFEAEDCAGNVGARELSLRRTSSQPQLQDPEQEEAPANHFQRR